MTWRDFWAPDLAKGAALKPGGVRQLLLALLLLLVFACGQALILAAYLGQGAPLAEPGDRLLLLYSPGTSQPRALEHLGLAGTALIAAPRVPGLYAVEVVRAGAGRAVGDDALALRLPRQATLASCFSLVTEGR